MLGGEADDQLLGAAPAGELRQDIGGRLELDAQSLPPVLRDLVGDRLGGLEVGHGGGHDDDVGRLERRRRGVAQLVCRLHVDVGDPVRAR